MASPEHANNNAEGLRRDSESVGVIINRLCCLLVAVNGHPVRSGGVQGLSTRHATDPLLSTISGSDPTVTQLTQVLHHSEFKPFLLCYMSCFFSFTRPPPFMSFSIMSAE